MFISVECDRERNKRNSGFNGGQLLPHHIGDMNCSVSPMCQSGLRAKLLSRFDMALKFIPLTELRPLFPSSVLSTIYTQYIHLVLL